MKYSATSLALIILLGLILSTALLKPSWQIGGDGFGYYAYIRSIIFDRDLDFTNEFQFFDSLYQTNTIEGWKTPIKKAGNPFAIGSSILWSPFVSIGHAIQNTVQTKYYINAHLPGFNLPYQISLGLGTWFFTLWGLGLLFTTLSKLFLVNKAWWSIIAIIGISPLPFYLIYEPSMSHGLTVFSTSLLFYLTIHWWREKQSSYRWLIYIGLSIGLAFLIRWQDLIFALLPLSLMINYHIRNKPNYEILAKQLLAIIIPAFIIAVPQLIVWKYLYGSWVTIPQTSGFFDLTSPHWLQFLFSGYHGLFIIHPLLILCLIGLCLAYKKQRELTIILLITLILQIYLNAGLSDWYAGGAFGARRMISSLFICALGLTALLTSLKNKAILTVFYLLIILGMIFNGLLMISYARGILPLNKPTSIQQIYTAPIILLSKIKI